ncbi:HAL/PAL/TAL family ammonia-lyase [Martelella mediterranea]|uniref:Histidine ammonia-lyase n=1 Tax=Martelella mediterranea DSM 17316 TaxID=1122214 RepID=A0A1U9Z848_9HYPH|nr:histidine ammonia-lyase [Martelella mediterranea]AQZ53871.1 Histidine ammonia-lyase [Martelella mediterranea DSM 17316]
MTAQTPVILSTDPPGIAEIVRIARHRAPVKIAGDLTVLLEKSRAVIERRLGENAPVYGLTTGLGAGVDTRLEPSDIAAFQQRVPEARAVGVGAGLSSEVVRAVMAARLAGFASGGAGVSPGVVASLAAALNAGFHPVIHALGSIGAADLAPLSDMARGLLGHGEVEFGGEIMDAGKALEKSGLPPLTLGPRDGHALVVGNSLSIGQACLAIDDLIRTLDWSFAAVALSFEAFRANVTVIDPRALSRRPAFGQETAGKRLADMLSGSGLFEPDAARRLQDPVSYRCAPQIWGALIHALEEATVATEIEIAGAGDNPVVLVEENALIHNGNFDTTAFALSFERLGLAIAQCASATAHRTMKIMSPGISELPRFLTPRGASRTGFATVQKTVSALEAEIRHLANPVAFSPIPVADGIEDHASMAPSVMAKTVAIIERFRWLVAIELIATSQAVDLRGVESLGAGASAAYHEVRSVVEPLDEDRAQAPDFSRMSDFIRVNGLMHEVQ